MADTAGAVVKKRFVQRLPYPAPKTFVGKGKLKEIFNYVTDNHIDIIIFDDELSASQLRNLSMELPCKILDRNNLILDIFARRARTADAIIRVELAQMNTCYLASHVCGLHPQRNNEGNCT